MLAYAASAPRTAERRSSPNALLAIIAGHVALVALVMSAKMDLPARLIDRPIHITWIDPIEPPPPNPIPHSGRHSQAGPAAADPLAHNPPLPGPDFNPNPPTADAIPGQGPMVTPTPDPFPVPRPAPVHLAAQLITPLAELKPPYPASKLMSEQEAVLKLKLTVDERGRVVSVEPVERADPVFLAAARRHLLAHWRYKPASEDGRAVSSTIVITLRFQLDG